MDKNTKLINEMKSALNQEQPKKKKVTLTEMVFGGNDYNPYEEEEPAPEQGNVPAEGEEPQGDMQPVDGQLASERSADPEVQGILANIRLAVIKGLAKLAEKPQTVEYDTLKKILAIVDKPIEAQVKGKQQGM